MKLLISVFSKAMLQASAQRLSVVFTATYTERRLVTLSSRKYIIRWEQQFEQDEFAQTLTQDNL